MAKRHERSLARRAALQVLYTAEIQLCDPADVLEDERCLTEDGVLSEYACRLVRGVSENIYAIDDKLANASENWAVDRMPLVDKSILRLAVYEMDFVDEVPVSVAINEAVELAKDFGGEDDSSRFVNGVLGNIARASESASEGADA